MQPIPAKSFSLQSLYCWGLAEPSVWRGGMKWVLGVHHQAGAFSFFHQKLCFYFDWQWGYFIYSCRTNEHFFREPAQQCCWCWPKGSAEHQSKFSCLAGLTSPMTHTSSRAQSTSEHPFRKAVWTPPTQAVGCQKKATNFSLRDRNSICWVCSWFWTPQGLQFFNNCFIRGKEKSSNLLGNLWTTISINILLGRLESLIDWDNIPIVCSNFCISH